MTEHDLQASIIAECDWRANQDPRWSRIFAVPNGGKRNKATAGKLKAEGVRPGVPDLLLLYPSRGYHGLALELKIGMNKLSEAQRDWQLWLREHNYCVETIRDYAQDAINLIEWYLSGDMEDGDK